MSMGRASGLRVSLMVSLGLVPLACGMTTGGGTLEDTGTPNGGGTGNVAGTQAGGHTWSGGGFAGIGNRGGAEGAPRACSQPKTDPLTGLVTCSEGYTH